jgi:acetyl-CoA C-acetyltransferase
LITIKNDDGQIALDRDEIIRADVTTELLAGFETSFSSFGVSYEALFKRVFPELGALEHVHHKGNSPGIVDGASMVLIGNREAGKKFELKARARVRSIKNASASEWLGLTGGIEAAKAVVFSGKMQAADIDLYEFNEAFASTSVKFRRELGVGPEIVNVNGGAISLGHAMGATGATLLGTVLDELERSDLTTGLVAVSGAAGVGTAMIIERV